MADSDVRLAWRFEIMLWASPRNGPVGAAAEFFCTGRFQEVAGLEVEAAAPSPSEHARPAARRRRPSHALVLRRGVFQADPSRSGDGGLWQWIIDVLEGARPHQTVEGTIRMRGPDGVLGATWTFARGTAGKLRGPELDPRSGTVAVEELTIAHEGVRLRQPSQDEG